MRLEQSPYGPAFRVLNSATQSLADDPATNTVPFDTEAIDTDGAHGVATSNLTGTVAKTAASSTLAGTGTAFTTELSVGQVITVPGTLNEHRTVIAIASATSLTVNANYAFTASGQTARFSNEGVSIPKSGIWVISAFVRFAANATGRRGLTIIQDSVLTLCSDFRLAAPTGVTDTSLTMPPKAMNKYDTLELSLIQDSGGALNATVVANSAPCLAGYWLRP